MKRALVTAFTFSIAALWLAPPADARRTERRLVRLLRPGWCALNPAAPGNDPVTFTADGPSATITFTAHSTDQRLDNLYLVEADVFEQFARPHGEAVEDCETDSRIYDFAAPGSVENMLELFDQEPGGWRFKDAAWIGTETAPRVPFGSSVDLGGALEFEPGGWARTTVGGLQAGKDYVVGGWSYWDGFTEGIVTVTVDTNVLTLHGGRFEVEVTWKSGGGRGPGHAVPVSDVMGLFWLSNPYGTDVMIKLLDLCSANGHFAVSISGLVERDVTLVITDTRTGRVVTHHNPFGTLFEPFKNREAFPCP